MKVVFVRLGDADPKERAIDELRVALFQVSDTDIEPSENLELLGIIASPDSTHDFIDVDSALAGHGEGSDCSDDDFGKHVFEYLCLVCFCN